MGRPKTPAIGSRLKGAQTFEQLQALNAAIVEHFKSGLTVEQAADKAGSSAQHARNILRIRGLIAKGKSA